jgi:predicted AlkP superfamily pyrophosphatase or phosphodiesterase
MKRTVVLNVVGLTRSLIGEEMPALRKLIERGSCHSVRPAFPAVTCSAQYVYLTGQKPKVHGIVGNGWYDRESAEVKFWKQSNQIVQAPKLWDALKAMNPEFTCAQLFWWYNMYASVDYSITPRPMYPADGRKVFDIYTGPLSLREAIKADLGEFPFPSFWGPRADIASSQWIADSAKWIEERYSPTLNLVYLPHLDYNLQRYGVSDPRIKNDLAEIDRVVGELVNFFDQREVAIVVLSEYGIEDVDTPIHLNRIFRHNGWLSIKDELGLEQLDCGASQAFAVADHQVAHVYVNDPSTQSAVRETLEQCAGVDQVLDRAQQQAWGIDHERSGDYVVIAKSGAWFTYYYWEDDALAPDFARCIDIHRKPGYDPCELFIDPKIQFPHLKIAKFLIKKKIGLRGLLDVIPLDAELVGGSHGRIPDDEADWPVLILPTEIKEQAGCLDSSQVYSTLINCITQD